MNDEDEIIISIMCPSGNTRWCPTPEQLMVLEELYRRGLRTPNAPQIQKITAHLSLYGNIQGKNVFYWFQNHKARDRQKLRNKLHRLYRHFPVPPPPSQFSLFQGDGGCEEVPVMRQKWRSSDPPKDDWLMMRTYGHDPSMIMEVGPALLPCCRSKSEPLQTLELFPLTPPTATANHQETLSGSCST